MILAVSKNSDREHYLYFPTNSYLDLTWHFFIHADNVGKIHFEKLSDLKALVIGATHEYSYTPEFWEAQLNLMVVSRNELIIPLLLAKRVDAAPMNTLATLHELKTKDLQDKIIYLPKPLSSKKYYNVFSKNSDYPKIETLVSAYDKVLEQMQNDGTIQLIFDRHLK